ncbi:MAG: UbiA family prenyltransferase, partial [Myxococcota bacterium]
MLTSSHTTIFARIHAWLQAARLPSQLYLSLPLLLGQSMAHAKGASLEYTRIAWLHLWGFLMQLYIVFTNDLADFEADQKNQDYTIFSGGSRVLVEDKISIQGLTRACWLVFSLLIGLGLTLSVMYTWTFLPLTLGGLMLLWMY